MKFIDEVRIVLESGRGGPGAVSFRREAFAPRGGPDGGDGGKGGDVIFRTTTHLNSLVDFRPGKKYAAQSGQPGAGANCSGQNGEDLILSVPVGTVIRSPEGEIIADLTDGAEFKILKGGRGGKGNAFFKTSVNQAPEKAQPGEEAESLEVILELKLIADVGIIGFPNAGKSTLISRISAAKPKIADYPFTTLTPHLGVVKAREFASFVVADIPGLIRGAHEGAGLGIQFLKHIERTRLFIHLIDVSGMTSSDPYQDYLDLNFELKMYDEANAGKEGFFALSERPQFVVFNKIDTVDEERLKRLQAEFKKKTSITPYLISGVTGKNVKQLIEDVARVVLGETDGERN